jgi:metal-responsive CopG/Arc/MetJ family transcriptional regulator
MAKLVEKKILLGLSKDLLKRIDAESRRQKTDRTQLIRRALNLFVDEMDARRDREKGSEDVSPFSE